MIILHFLADTGETLVNELHEVSVDMWNMKDCFNAYDKAGADIFLDKQVRISKIV